MKREPDTTVKLALKVDWVSERLVPTACDICPSSDTTRTDASAGPVTGLFVLLRTMSITADISLTSFGMAAMQ